jgi:hypothetical protein
MEYVEGVDLRHLVQRLKQLGRRLPPELALRIAIESLKGLHYAHERSLKNRGRLDIVHRDVSPQNILLSFEGEVKVTDFGIAKAMTQSHETQTGVLKGKYAYMSPEQARGAALDARTDVFAAGIVLFELLFARRLFAAPSEVETLDKVRKAEIPWPEESAELFPGLKSALAKALRQNPNERFADAESFAEALAACLPAEKKSDRRALAGFLAEVFSEEIVQRRQQAQEQGHGTDSFRRQTKMKAPEEEPTVSLAEEAPTELELSPESPAQAREENLLALEAVSRRRRNSLRYFAAVVLFAVILAPLWFYLAGKRKGREPSETKALATATPESRPAAALPLAAPLPTPSPVLGSLHLKAVPESAQIRARFAGEERKEIGSLRLERLPVGTEVKADVALANYEAEAKTFTVGSEPSPTPHVFQLTKKAPALGSLRVNAAPWGRVTVAGYFSGQETPATRGKIPEGRYSVTVRNPALGKTLSSSAAIKGGKTTQCYADFEGGRMRCW